MPSVVH
jgi:hypothetical protein